MHKQTITLTDLDIERCEGAAHSYRVEVIRLLGGMLPGDTQPRQGWKIGLRGKVISRCDYEQALAISKLPRLKNIPNGEARGQMSLL